MWPAASDNLGAVKFDIGIPSKRWHVDKAKLCIERYQVVVGGLSIGATPDPLTPPLLTTWCIQLFVEIKTKRWQLEQRVSVVKTLLLLSTRHLNRNSLPRCAHSSCTCTKLFTGFTLCLMHRICPAYRRPYSLIACGLNLSKQVITINYNYSRAGIRRRVSHCPTNWWAFLLLYRPTRLSL